MAEIEVLSLGGSLVFPEKIDFKFLKNFQKFILKWQRKKKFLIFVGGGKIAREYQNVAKKFLVSQSQLDWIGILATWLNAYLVKSLFKNKAFSQVLSDPSKKIKTEKKIIVFGGWKPGRSTDYDAVMAAKNFKVKRLINLSDVDFVFDKDPKKFKDAKPLKKISFEKLFKIIGKKWIPGMRVPFDPIAAKLAQREKIKIFILNGKNFKNLNDFFEGRKFKGTIVE